MPNNIFGVYKMMSNHKYETTYPFSLSRNTSINFNHIWNTNEKKWIPEETNSTATEKSAFGEPLSIEINPVVQLDGIYGLPSDKFEKLNAFGGSISYSNSLMKVETSSLAYSYAVLRSKRTIRYRPGQGALARFTAQFSDGVEGYIQRAGFFSQEDAIQVGFQGEDFGVLLQRGGKAKIMKLELTSPASGSEIITITLNGTQTIINVSATTLQENIIELFKNNYLGGWILNQVDNSLYFLSSSLGVKDGLYSISTSAGGTLSGFFTEIQSGVENNEIFVNQSDFNIDKLDGTGDSGFILDPTKLNVYQIKFRWLGAGEIKFAIENELNGDMIHFHSIRWSNKNELPHVSNPSMKIGYVVASLGGTGSILSVSGASIMGAIEGKIAPISLPISSYVYRSSPDIPANTNTHLISLKNNLTCDKRINQREIILKNISIAATANAATPAFVYLYYDTSNASDSTTNSDLYFTSNGSSFSSYSVNQTTMKAGLRAIAVFSVTAGSSETIDLSSLRIVIPPQSKISLSISSSAQIKTAEVSINYIED